MINLSTPCMYKKNEELSCEAALHAMQGCKFFWSVVMRIGTKDYSDTESLLQNETVLQNGQRQNNTARKKDFFSCYLTVAQVRLKWKWAQGSEGRCKAKASVVNVLPIHY